MFCIVIGHVNQSLHNVSYNWDYHQQFPSVFIAPRNEKQDEDNRRNVINESHINVKICYVSLNLIN